MVSKRIDRFKTPIPRKKLLQWAIAPCRRAHVTVDCRWRFELEDLVAALTLDINPDAALHHAQEFLSGPPFCDNEKPNKKEPRSRKVREFILKLISEGVTDPMIVRAVAKKFGRKLRIGSLARYRS